MPVRKTIAILSVAVVMFSVAAIIFMEGLNQMLDPYFNNPWNWIGLSLLIIGLIPLVYKFRVLTRFWWLLLLIGAVILFISLIFS